MKVKLINGLSTKFSEELLAQLDVEDGQHESKLKALMRSKIPRIVEGNFYFGDGGDGCLYLRGRDFFSELLLLGYFCPGITTMHYATTIDGLSYWWSVLDGCMRSTPRRKTVFSLDYPISVQLTNWESPLLKIYKEKVNAIT